MVDTADVARRLGTEPKILRRFLRSSSSPVRAVGSGARYQITPNDLAALTEAFQQWAGNRPAVPSRMRSLPHSRKPVDDQMERDQQVWEEERQRREAKGRGPIVLEDIRKPGVRAKVKKLAQEQEDRLNARLLAMGLHITQRRES